MKYQGDVRQVQPLSYLPLAIVYKTWRRRGRLETARRGSHRTIEGSIEGKYLICLFVTLGWSVTMCGLTQGMLFPPSHT